MSEKRERARQVAELFAGGRIHLAPDDVERLRRGAPPPPVLVVEWGVGPDGIVLTVRQGRARAPWWETFVEWNKTLFNEDGQEFGYAVRPRVLPGYSTTVTGAAQRGLALLSAVGHWSPDLRDYVQAKAIREDRLLRDIQVRIMGWESYS